MRAKKDDWTFIDWADMDKTGAICAEQMLLIAAYFALGNIAKILNRNHEGFHKKAKNLKALVNKYYWNDDLGAFIDSYQSGKNNVTRHANIFAIMYDIATDAQKEIIENNVLKNIKIPKITTPYFKGYELDVMAKLGNLSYVENELNSYWGEMINNGAKTIWEQFDVNETGIERYAMYDDKYDKSLCHAWGAAPVYIFGRYYLGVYPTSPGFRTFNVEPNIGTLSEFNGIVPVCDGFVEISLNRNRLTVKTTKQGGRLIWKNESISIEPGVELTIEEK